MHLSFTIPLAGAGVVMFESLELSSLRLLIIALANVHVVIVLVKTCEASDRGILSLSLSKWFMYLLDDLFCLLVVFPRALGIEPRTLHLPGRRCTTGHTPAPTIGDFRWS